MLLIDVPATLSAGIVKDGLLNVHLGQIVLKPQFLNDLRCEQDLGDHRHIHCVYDSIRCVDGCQGPEAASSTGDGRRCVSRSAVKR